MLCYRASFVCAGKIAGIGMAKDMYASYAEAVQNLKNIYDQFLRKLGLPNLGRFEIEEKLQQGMNVGDFPGGIFTYKPNEQKCSASIYDYNAAGNIVPVFIGMIDTIFVEERKPANRNVKLS